MGRYAVLREERWKGQEMAGRMRSVPSAGGVVVMLKQLLLSEISLLGLDLGS